MSSSSSPTKRKEKAKKPFDRNTSDLTSDSPASSLHGTESVGTNKTASSSVGSVVKKNVTAPMGKAVRQVGAAVRSTSDSVGEGLRRRRKQGGGSSRAPAVGGDESAPFGDETESAEWTASPSKKEVRFSAATTDVKLSKEEDPTKTRSAKVIEVGPWMEVLLRDTSISIGLALLLGVVSTWKNWHLVVGNQVPVWVSFTWMILAAAVGQEVERIKLSRKTSATTSAPVQRFSARPIPTEDDEISASIPSVIEVPQEYSFVGRVSRGFPKLKLKFRDGKPKKRRSKVWTTLGRPRSKRQPWDRRGFVPVSQSLTDTLLKDPGYRRKSLAVMVQEQKDECGVNDSATQASWLGTFDSNRLDASSMDKEVVVPLFKLRGMDVFVTEGAEESLGTHPFLIQNGLRDCPTWIVNILTQWGNLVVYLELPDWIKDWDNIQEQTTDPPDVLAFKRFVNGDDAYRNARLRVMPHIVDGPMPVRVLTPKGKELLVAREYVPVTWRKYPHVASTNTTTTSAASSNSNSNRTLYPCLETELDCMSNKTMRGMAGIVKRYLNGLSLDVAALIVPPPDMTTSEDEPKACISTWSFDKIDVTTCPDMPPRVANSSSMTATTSGSVAVPNNMSEQEERDLIRASRYAGLTPKQVEQVRLDVVNAN